MDVTGDFEGDVVGTRVGEFVTGAALGLVDGFEVGAGVGVDVSGEVVGDMIGASLGTLVTGAALGKIVGLGVGIDVGEEVDGGLEGNVVGELLGAVVIGEIVGVGVVGEDVLGEMVGATLGESVKIEKKICPLKIRLSRKMLTLVKTGASAAPIPYNVRGL